jgi:hypothetical protein
MVGDLEHVYPGQPSRDESRIDVVFGVAGQQKPPILVIAEEHDRGVVGLAVVGRRRVQERWPDGAIVRP